MDDRTMLPSDATYAFWARETYWRIHLHRTYLVVYRLDRYATDSVMVRRAEFETIAVGVAMANTIRNNIICG